MCLTGIHGQIYMAWTVKKEKKKNKTEELSKMLEVQLEGIC